MTLIAVPKILRDKLTEQGADALVQIIDKAEDRSQKIVLEMAEERFEKRVAHVEAKIVESEARLESKIVKSESLLESKINGLEIRMAQFEARIIRWMFIFWIGQFASTVGALSVILFAFFKR